MLSVCEGTIDDITASMISETKNKKYTNPNNQETEDYTENCKEKERKQVYTSEE